MALVDKIKSIAKGEVGTHEGRSGGHWNNDQKYSKEVPGLAWSNWQAWCATFVSWVAWMAGASELYPRTASCATGVAWFKRIGRFSEYPAVGAQVFYGPGGGSHTGLVMDFDDDWIYTVEGNTNDSGSAEGDGVYAKKRARRSDWVYGYGYPKFPEGIKSADPAYKSEAPKPAAKPTVKLANVVEAARKDPSAAQGHTTHATDVKRVEAALKAEGLLPAKYAADGSFGSTTVEAYAEWQRKCGVGGPYDGIPGVKSLTLLGNKHGFKVA